VTSTTRSNDLVNPAQLAKEFGLAHKAVGEWLIEAGLKPEHTMPFGRGFMRLYEPGPARDAVRARMPKPAPAATAVGPIEAISAAAILKSLGYTYHGAENWQAPPAAPSVVLDVLEERVEALTAEVGKLQAQNRVLLSTMEGVRDSVAALVKGLGGV